MKNLTKLFVFAISLAGLTTSANAQSTATGTATTTSITPISIQSGVSLNFGTIASSGTAGTVSVGYADDATYTLGVKSPGNLGDAKTGTFTVTGAGTSGFTIELPTTFDLTAGANTLTVSNITAENGTSGTLVAGTQTIKIGATLAVPENTVAGNYTNDTDLIVSVNYN